MSYCTQDDLVRRYGNAELVQLTDRVNYPPSVIDNTIVQQAIVDAAAEMDGYLQGRYALPMTVVPDSLTAYACDIARYRLYDDRVTERVADAYDEAIKYLMDVAKGSISLGVDQAGQAAPGTGGPSGGGAERVFSKCTLKDFL
jgi:phage gp36-like protein